MPNPRESAICPIFVGRQQDLTRLEQLTERALASQGQIALISGEAGIGKSRLAAEIKVYARGRALILEGFCFETDATLPYGPLLDMFRGYLALEAPKPAPELFGPFAGDIAPLFPELESHGRAASGQDQHRLFLGFAHALTSLAYDRPLLIILEDLHWSDSATLEFLALFARRITPQPIAVILTFRSEENRPALTHLLAELEHARLSVEFELQRMNSSEVEVMLRAIFDLQAPVRADFLEAVYALAEGNPFFVEEMVKSLSAVGDIFYVDGHWERKEVRQLRIPRSVHDAIQRRTRQLDARARGALTLAAVAGRRFDVRLLQHVLAISDDELMLMLKALLSAQLLVEYSADQFMFRHALTREAIYAGLLQRERQAAHRTLGEALEQLPAGAAGPPLADLSYHFSEAQAWPKAFEYSRLAGERARRLYAPREALALFSRAVEAGRQLGWALPSDLLRARGQALEALGDFEAARAAFEAATAEAARQQDRAAEWQGVIDLGALWASRDYQKTGDFYRQAGTLADEMQAAPLRAESLNRMGNWWVNVGQTAEGLEAHRESLEIFTRLGDTQGMANTYDLLGMASLHAGDLPASYREYQQAIGLYRSLDDRSGLAAALIGACHASYWDEADDVPVQSYRENRAVAGQALKLVRGQEALAAQAYVLWSSAVGRANYGDFGGALAEAREALEIATGIEHRQWITGAYYAVGHTYLQMLQGTRAVAALEQGLRLAQELGSAWWIGNVTADLALAHLLNSNTTQAGRVLEAALTEGGARRNLIERRMLLARGSVRLGQGQPAEALRLVEDLLNVRHGSVAAAPIPALWHLKGRALLALKQAEAAEQAFEQARRGAEAREARPLLLQVYLSLGRLFVRQRRPAQAEQALEQARRILGVLVEDIPDTTLKDDFERAVFRILPALQRARAVRAPAGQFGSLTRREREVARGLMSGKSNREIADVLYLSERTVENHITHILAKLSLDSRLQIAAWAKDNGLGEVEP